MKEIKKISLKIFSKNNVKNLIFILFIKTILNLFLIFLSFFIIFSFFNFKNDGYNFFPFIQNIPIFYFGLILLLVYSFCVFMPLRMGVYLWFSKLKKDSVTPLSTIFLYYRNFKLFAKTILFELILLLKMVLNFIFCLGPALGLLLFCSLKFYDFPQDFQIFARILILIAIFSIFVGILLFFKLQISQIVTKFLFVQNKQNNILNIIKSSNFLLHNNNKEFTKFLYSFWHYLFFCIFIIPIPFVFAYFEICMFQFTKKIIYKQNQGIVAIPLNQKVIDINL